jgi:hypothetical protein
MNTIVDCYALHLVRSWSDHGDVIRVQNEGHKYILETMDSRYYDREDRVCTAEDTIADSCHVMLDFREQTNVKKLMAQFEEDIVRDIYTDRCVVVFTLHDDDDGSLNYVEHWVRGKPEVNFIAIPEYLRRSEHPDEMFSPEYDFSRDRWNFAVAHGVVYFFLELNTGKTIRRGVRKVVKEVNNDRTKRVRVEEPMSPVSKMIEVNPNPFAIDMESRVFGDFNRFVKFFTGEEQLSKCSSISLLGKYLVCFDRVVPATPPIVRATRFIRETGEKEAFLVPISDVVIVENVVVSHRDRFVDVNKSELNKMLALFLNEANVEINGDVCVELHDFYVLFHTYCRHEHGFYLNYLHMHLWFFQSCGDLYNTWVVKRDNKFYVRCMNIDVIAVTSDFKSRGWEVHKNLAQIII